MKVGQKEAVINAVMSVLSDRGVDYELGGETLMSEVISTQDKEKVREIIFTMFKNGEITYKDSFEYKVQDDSKLKTYVSSLLNNWLRKAKEFNNGQTPKIKNPGSRAGSTDAQVKEMRKLLSVTTDPQAQAAIQEALNARLAEIKAEKNKVEIDYDAIPAELLEQLNIAQ